MSSKRAERRGRRLMACGLLIALAWVLAPTRAAAKARNAQPLKQDQACLACHGTAGMTSDKGKDIYINPAKHAVSAHAILDPMVYPMDTAWLDGTIPADHDATRGRPTIANYRARLGARNRQKRRAAE
jgi:hypothetical protein